MMTLRMTDVQHLGVIVETVYVPATPGMSLAQNSAFLEALNQLAEDFGADVRFQITVPRPKAADLMSARMPPPEST